MTEKLTKMTKMTKLTKKTKMTKNTEMTEVSDLSPGSGVAKALAKTSTNAKFRCRRAFNHYCEDGGDNCV